MILAMCLVLTKGIVAVVNMAAWGFDRTSGEFGLVYMLTVWQYANGKGVSLLSGNGWTWLESRWTSVHYPAWRDLRRLPQSRCSSNRCSYHGWCGAGFSDWTTTDTQTTISLIQENDLYWLYCMIRLLRLTAYRQFTYWVHRNLGKRVRRVIPACAVIAIRKKFLYTGFKASQHDHHWPGWSSQTEEWKVFVKMCKESKLLPTCTVRCWHCIQAFYFCVVHCLLFCWLSCLSDVSRNTVWNCGCRNFPKGSSVTISLFYIMSLRWLLLILSYIGLTIHSFLAFLCSSLYLFSPVVVVAWILLTLWLCSSAARCVRASIPL